MSERLAIDGGRPARAAPFPRYAPPPAAEDARPVEVFERELSALLGGLAVVACAGREQALTVAAQAVGLAGCEVLTPDLHGGPAADALRAAGLHPVPAAVDPETVCISARGLARAAGERTRAVVVTHAFGHPAAMRDMLRLAQEADLAVLEDITEALGATYDGRLAGGLGHAAVLGFGTGHLLTGGEGGEGGEGGAVIVADEETAATVRARVAERGVAAPEAAVRVALAELRGIDAALQARRQSAWHLTYELRGVRGLAKMPHGRRIRHAYDCYVVRLRSMLWRRPLPETVEALRAEGIPCAPALGPPLHEDGDVRAALGEDDPRLRPEHFAAAAQLPDELLAIPLAGTETTADMNDVAEALRKLSRASVGELDARTPAAR